MTDQSINLTLPFPPSVNHYWRMVVIKGRGPVMLISKDGREYKSTVARECTLRHLKPFSGEVAVTFTAYRPRKSGDLDNLQKSLFDALKGFAWHDDKQIVEIHAYRSDDKLRPRVEVEVTQIEAVQELFQEPKEEFIY
jgi:crossover junction endodeoxyribonuclease RusA